MTLIKLIQIIFYIDLLQIHILQRRKVSDDENVNEDEDEMLFVRGASPIRKDSQENNSPRHTNDHENFDSNSDYDERPNVNRHRDNDNKRSSSRGGGGGKDLQRYINIFIC